jgi:hypothetical protein
MSTPRPDCAVCRGKGWFWKRKGGKGSGYIKADCLCGKRRRESKTPLVARL